jgi:hypothetical protein
VDQVEQFLISLAGQGDFAAVEGQPRLLEEGSQRFDEFFVRPQAVFLVLVLPAVLLFPLVGVFHRVLDLLGQIVNVGQEIFPCGSWCGDGHGAHAEAGQEGGSFGGAHLAGHRAQDGPQVIGRALCQSPFYGFPEGFEGQFIACVRIGHLASCSGHGSWEFSGMPCPLI